MDDDAQMAHAVLVNVTDAIRVSEHHHLITDTTAEPACRFAPTEQTAAARVEAASAGAARHHGPV
jgi:hypothetical protein